MKLPEFVRVSFSPLVIVALVLSVPLTLWGLIASIDDPRDKTSVGLVIYVVPSLVCAVAMLEVVWARLPISRTLEMLRRTILIPISAGAVSAIAVGIACLVLGLPESAGPNHLSFAADDPHPMVKAGIAGAALGCAVGLGLLLLVVGPLIALLHADDFVDFNYADIEDDERPLARTAVRLIAFTLMFVVPFGVGMVMEWMWMWLTSVAIMIVLVARVVIVQRRLGRSPV